ncbi:MAG: JmjC domain-containing protein [Acidimicrobiales bacterium]
MTVSNLAELLDPVGVDEFLADYYGQRWCYIPGGPRKFDGLFDWADVNRTLAHHHLDWIHRDRDGALDRPRLGMVKEGQNLRNDVLVGPVEAPDGSRRSQIDQVALTHQVRGGTTLYGGDLGDYHPALGALATNVGRVLGERVKMGMHAVTRTVSGRKGHSDAFDIFVLQVAGRKRWRLRGRDPLRPIVGQAVAPNPDPGPVELDAVLEPGDVLYVPVGWWHDPCAVDGPSLHMNVTILPRTGDHFLAWMRSAVESLPSFAAAASAAASGESPDAALMAALRDDVSAMVTPESLARFLHEAAEDARQTERLAFAFPETGTPDDGS